MVARSTLDNRWRRTDKAKGRDQCGEGTEQHRRIDWEGYERDGQVVRDDCREYGRDQIR